MSSDLVELGQQALAAVSSDLAKGAPLVKCQLLACGFYEALRYELRRADEGRRSRLAAVTDQCDRASVANISPETMVGELRRALALLQLPSEPPPRARAVLRVIQGGLSER
jgi:hypothetical protein